MKKLFNLIWANKQTGRGGHNKIDHVLKLDMVKKFAGCLYQLKKPLFREADFIFSNSNFAC